MRKIYVKFYILLGYIICFLDRKGKEMRFKNLAIFYVNMILEGNITFDEVPKLLKRLKLLWTLASGKLLREVRTERVLIKWNH